MIERRLHFSRLHNRSARAAFIGFGKCVSNKLIVIFSKMTLLAALLINTKMETVLMRGGLLAFSGDDSFQLVGIGVGNMVSLCVPFGVGIAENGQREVGAFVESTNANFRYGSGEKDGTQGAALGKSNVLDFCDGIGNDNGNKRRAALKCACFNFRHRIRNENAGKGSAVGKQIVTDFCKGIWKHNRSQSAALGEGSLLDFCDGIGNDDGRQRGAVVEST